MSIGTTDNGDLESFKILMTVWIWAALLRCGNELEIHIKNKPLSQTNVHLRDPEKRRQALLRSVFMFVRS